MNFVGSIRQRDLVDVRLHPPPLADSTCASNIMTASHIRVGEAIIDKAARSLDFYSLCDLQHTQKALAGCHSQSNAQPIRRPRDSG
jgi:hypothetical protein